MPTNEVHPVWEVYDLHRTCRLNVKYWARKLVVLRRVNFGMEYLIMVTAPGSAVAGLVFWQSSSGKIVWSVLTAITAFVSLAKPLLRLSAQVENLQKVVSGYRSIESQIEELESDIKRECEYTPSMVAVFKSAQKQFQEVAKNEPLEEVDESLRRKCFEAVKQELPVQTFYIPSQ